MSLVLRDQDVELHHGDALEVLREFRTHAADACVTSPPYLDARPEYPSPSLDEFELVFHELRRVVSGPLLLNVGRLWREKEEMLWWVPLVDRAERMGWPLRDTLIWIKPNANPLQGEVITNAHEYVFLFGDGFNPDAVRTPYSPESIARYNRRFVKNSAVKNDAKADGRPSRITHAHELGARPKSYVEITTGREKGNPHPAPMPLELATHLVALSGGSVILDPFMGSGTTLLAARSRTARGIGIERDAEYVRIACERLLGRPLEQQSLLAETGEA